jgi:hypothetical protein
VRSERTAYIIKGGRAANLIRGLHFCGRIYIGKEDNYQQFPKLRLEQRTTSKQAQHHPAQRGSSPAQTDEPVVLAIRPKSGERSALLS